jgi:nitrogen fixation/metabolism regulation signal transduction histidine kinase
VENQPQYQRKTVIIKRGLQYRYMLFISAVSFIAFMLVIMDMIWTLHKVSQNHPMIIEVLDEVFSSIPLMFFKIALYLIVVVILAVVISHKIAGPIYKFEKICELISKGDMTQRVYLRKGDALVELQNSFNTMMKNINSIMKINEDFRKKLKEKNIETSEIEKIEKEIKEIMPDYKV